MKKTITLVSAVILIGVTVLFLFQSCNKDTSQFTGQQGVFPKSSSNAPNFTESEGLMVLGEQLEDPYNIANMQQAFFNLQSQLGKGAPLPVSQIEPNMVYLRFLPNDEDEWDELRMDTTLLFFDFPLDYEIETYGRYYHDPTLPEDAITWQYTVVPIDYPIPNIYYEILYEVFIPPTESEPAPNNPSQTYIFYEELMNESLILTGNLDPNLPKGSKWKPSGSVYAYDYLMDDWHNGGCDGYIPVERAKVRAKYFVNINSAETDANGNFSINSNYRNDVTYLIVWETGKYDIRDGNTWQAKTQGPTRRGAWHATINSNQKSVMFATIHRAANKMFYGDNFGIKRPDLASTVIGVGAGLGKTKICYLDKNGTSQYQNVWNVFGVIPNIQIFGKWNNIYQKTNIIFATTIHELAHQSHNRYVGNIQYWETSKLIKESWAVAVEWALTNHEYHTLGNKYNSNKAKTHNHYYEHYQAWERTRTDWEYSPLFVDLMDNYNQRDGTSYAIIMPLNWPPILPPVYPNRPNDKIHGYTLKEAQDKVLNNSTNLSSFKTAVKNNKPLGATFTNTDVDEFCALY
jgi:hypothetical protein